MSIFCLAVASRCTRLAIFVAFCAVTIRHAGANVFECDASCFNLTATIPRTMLQVLPNRTVVRTYDAEYYVVPCGPADATKRGFPERNGKMKLQGRMKGTCSFLFSREHPRTIAAKKGDYIPWHHCTTCRLGLDDLQNTPDSPQNTPPAPNPKQKHLVNRDQGEIGHDVGSEDAWKKATGKNVLVAIVDQAVDFFHMGLLPNYLPSCSYNFISDSEKIVLPKPHENHGTLVAGIISASRYSMCGPGIAYDSRFYSLQIFEGVKSAKFYYSRIYSKNISSTSIYSSSYGLRATDALGNYLVRVLVDELAQTYWLGTILGRNKRGSIYNFSGRNAARRIVNKSPLIPMVEENCQYDGIRSSLHVVVTGAITYSHTLPGSEVYCSALLFSTYSDLFSTSTRDTCSNIHASSASTALASGLIALVMEIKDFTWEDIFTIGYKAAVPILPMPNAEWRILASGKYFSPYAGFGLITATSMLQQAESHVPGSQRWTELEFAMVSTFGRTVLPGLLFVSLSPNYMVRFRIIRVAVKIWISSMYRGDVEIVLRSPVGTASKLLTARLLDYSSEAIRGMWLVSNEFWGETVYDPVFKSGVWQLQVWRQRSSAYIARWKLIFLGYHEPEQRRKSNRDPRPGAKLENNLAEPYRMPVSSFFYICALTHQNQVGQPACSAERRQSRAHEI